MGIFFRDNIFCTIIELHIVCSFFIRDFSELARSFYLCAWKQTEAKQLMQRYRYACLRNSYLVYEGHCFTPPRIKSI